MIAGAGANIGVQVGEDGVVVVMRALASRPMPSSPRSKDLGQPFDTVSTPAPILIT